MGTPWIAAFGQQLAQQTAGAGMGLLLSNMADKRQLNMERKLQRMQMEGSKEMTDYNQRKQLELWEATSYKAQKDQLIKAGLNPGLLYGMGGGGGQTASIATGQAPTGQAPKGGAEATAMGTGMGMNLALMAAQADNLKADADLKRSQIPTAGQGIKESNARIQEINQSIDESIARIGKIGQEVKNLQAQETVTKLEAGLKQLQKDYETATFDDRVNMINTTLAQAKETLAQLQNQTDVSNATKETQINQIKANYFKTLAETALIKAQTRLTDEQTRKAGEEIIKIWNDIWQGRRRLDIESRKASDDWYIKNKPEHETDPVLDFLDNIGVILPFFPKGVKAPGTVPGFHDRSIKNRYDK